MSSSSTATGAMTLDAATPATGRLRTTFETSLDFVIQTDWIEVAPFERLPVDRGVAALVSGTPVAVFRLGDGSVHAIAHVEPFTGVPVMARGLVGSIDDRPTVASPLHKQRFDLRTGESIDEPGRSIRTWPVEVTDGIVRVGARQVLARAAA